MKSRWGLVAPIIAGAALVVGVGGAVVAGAQSDPRDRADRADNRKLIESLEARRNAYGEPSDTRRLSNPTAIEYAGQLAPTSVLM